MTSAQRHDDARFQATKTNVASQLFATESFLSLFCVAALRHAYVVPAMTSRDVFSLCGATSRHRDDVFCDFVDELPATKANDDVVSLRAAANRRVLNEEGA